jgi:hypothetical protein
MMEIIEQHGLLILIEVKKKTIIIYIILSVLGIKINNLISFILINKYL